MLFFFSEKFLFYAVLFLEIVPGSEFLPEVETFHQFSLIFNCILLFSRLHSDPLFGCTIKSANGKKTKKELTHLRKNGTLTN